MRLEDLTAIGQASYWPEVAGLFVNQKRAERILKDADFFNSWSLLAPCKKTLGQVYRKEIICFETLRYAFSPPTATWSKFWRSGMRLVPALMIWLMLAVWTLLFGFGAEMDLSMTGVISRVLQHKLLFIETAASWLRIAKAEGYVTPVEVPQSQCRSGFPWWPLSDQMGSRGGRTSCSAR